MSLSLPLLLPLRLFADVGVDLVPGPPAIGDDVAEDDGDLSVHHSAFFHYRRAHIKSIARHKNKSVGIRIFSISFFLNIILSKLKYENFEQISAYITYFHKHINNNVKQCD